MLHDLDEEDSWEVKEVMVPDLTNMATVVNLAKIANDAYALPGDPRWMELDQFNLVRTFILVRRTRLLFNIRSSRPFLSAGTILRLV